MFEDENERLSEVKIFNSRTTMNHAKPYCDANLAVLTNIGKYRFDVDAVNSAGGVPGGGTIRSLGFSSKILRNGWMSAVSLGRRHGRYALLWYFTKSYRKFTFLLRSKYRKFFILRKYSRIEDSPFQDLCDRLNVSFRWSVWRCRHRAVIHVAVQQLQRTLVSGCPQIWYSTHGTVVVLDHGLVASHYYISVYTEDYEVEVLEYMSKTCAYVLWKY